MKNIITALLTATLLTACATTAGPKVTDFNEQRQSVKVALMPMDVEVKFAKVGSTDVRVDWTETARENFETSLRNELVNSGETVVDFEFISSDESSEQLFLLQQHVEEAITSHVVSVNPLTFKGTLPHKKGQDQMTYSLGSSVQSLKAQTGADYAAFLTNRTVVESGGSIFTKIALGAVTGYAPGLSSFRGTYVSLVDLDSGEVKWLNANVGGISGDPRSAEVADKIVGKIFTASPFSDEE
ncbi:MAG: hypothetical protein ABJ275_10540 [Maricaulaceae bacterium]